ncbi:MAG: M56 family metallopeptidase [Terracidiphilus sp.]|jgi:beta-lactamase regulating signal transducer with metallopeptidase domain
MPLMHMADAVLAGLAGSGSAFVAAFAAFAQAAAPAAVAALWQSAAIAIALVLCLRLAPRVSAAHRFATWAAGFAVVASLPFIPLLAHFGDGCAAAPLAAGGARPWLELDSRWGFVIAALWLAASIFRAAELVFQSLRLRRLWKAATPVETEGNLRTLLVAASPAQPIEICTTRDLDRPSVIGFLAPRILIPEWLFSRLTPGELEQVVLHEAEHLRRRDDWTNLLQKFLLVLFPLNPSLAWMERQLCREREMACDEGVVRRTQAPRAYAACLTALAERGLQQRELLRRAQALSLGAFERRPELVHRVHSILRRKQALHPLAAGALVSVLGCGLVVGSVELARSPQLVAFVAAPKPDVQLAALAPLLGPAGPTATDAVLRPSQRFHAIKTNAAVPTSRNDVARPPARPLRSEDSSAGVTETAMTDRDAATPRAELVKAVAPTSATAPAQGQEFVVLTAWEEVQTSVTRTRPIADYDTGAGAREQISDMTSRPAATRATEITVTRIVLVVYPADSATATQTAPTTGFHSHQPATPSVDSGRMGLQL